MQTLNYSPDQVRDARGRWTTGGKDPSSTKGSNVEKEMREVVGGMSSTELAHPPIIFGDVPVPHEEFSTYLERNGREWKAAPLPEGMKMGTPRECFKNATEAVWSVNGLD